MGINNGRFHGVGARPLVQPTFSGVQNYPYATPIPGTTNVLASLVVTQQQAQNDVTYNSSVAPTAITINNKATTIPLQVFPAAGIELFRIDGSGNAFCFAGDFGAGAILGEWLTFDGATNPPSLKFTSGATGNRFYIAAIAPSSNSTAAANVNDWWYNSAATTTGNYFWSCTVAGTPGTWSNFI